MTDKGSINEYKKLDLIYRPQIIKTKEINKQKSLNIIRDKISNNCKLTKDECSLLITLPLFKTEESEEEITRDVCEYIKNKKHCFPEDMLDEILAMYLNILEYVDEDKRDELLEMINMAEAYKGIIAEIR